ncbi:unnamed protein product [Moneuplotes crassus]|uniref:SKP1 component dimerisation domain-containing protein n=1 Tax=Euplotes crassus TaxID=5936 RepID=A0AAD1ULK6_EUPCR|nr:unnamed protein product [Moneuplotes crassus]
METSKVSVLTADGKIFEMDPSDALEIAFIRGKMENNDETEEIKLEHVDYSELEKVVQFLHQLQIKPYKMPIPKPLPSDRLEDFIDVQWYIDFIDMPKKDLLKLIRAANFLNIERLFELACAKIGSQIKGMTIEELREFFEIVNDFTNNEEETIMIGKANIYQHEQDSTIAPEQ